MSIRGLFFQWASTIKIQLSVLIYNNKADLIIISLKNKLCSPWYNWKIAELALNNNHSLTHSLTHSLKSYITCTKNSNFSHGFLSTRTTKWFKGIVCEYLIIFFFYFIFSGGRRGRDRMVVVPVQSVPITTKVVSSNPAHGGVYSIQHVMKYVSDLRHIFRLRHGVQFHR
jgi:hypothetical protein